MDFFIQALIFMVVLFLYLHLVQQWKRSEDLEIYEMDYTTNEQLQEVCDIKQPVLFEYASIFPEFFERLTMEKLVETYGQYDVKVKESTDYYKTISGLSADLSIDNKLLSEPIDYMVLPLQTTHIMMTTDPKAVYFSENNDEFIEDSGYLGSLFEQNDTHFKPSFTVQTKYDVCFGSKEVQTPLRYHTDYRQFICVNSGKIIVKMTPWKSSKYLHPIKDYDHYEFRSPVNVWKPQKPYLHDMDKTKFLEFDVPVGKVLYIPPYWWYSIQYSAEPDTMICRFTYNTIMNSMATLPDRVRHMIANYNSVPNIRKLETNDGSTTDVPIDTVTAPLALEDTVGVDKVTMPMTQVPIDKMPTVNTSMDTIEL